MNLIESLILSCIITVSLIIIENLIINNNKNIIPKDCDNCKLNLDKLNDKNIVVLPQNENKSLFLNENFTAVDSVDGDYEYKCYKSKKENFNNTEISNQTTNPIQSMSLSEIEEIFNEKMKKINLSNNTENMGNIDNNDIMPAQVSNPMPAQVLNPMPAQVLNPMPAQVLNPMPSQVSNPILTQVSNPMTAQVSNPMTAQVSNPILAQVSNPILAQVSNPILAQVSNPITAQVSNPITAQVSNPIPAQVSNPIPAQVSNPIPAQVLNTMTEQVFNYMPSQVLNTITEQVSNYMPAKVLNTMTEQVSNYMQAQVSNPILAQVLNPMPAQVLNPMPAQVLNPMPAQVLNPMPAQVSNPILTQVSNPMTAQVSNPMTVQSSKENFNLLTNEQENLNILNNESEMIMKKNMLNTKSKITKKSNNLDELIDDDIGGNSFDVDSVQYQQDGIQDEERQKALNNNLFRMSVGNRNVVNKFLEAGGKYYGDILTRSTNAPSKFQAATNELKYGDYNYLAPLNKGMINPEYTFISPSNWYPIPPHPPVCVTNKSCTTCPIIMGDGKDYMQFASLDDFDKSRRFTGDMNINIDYIKNVLNNSNGY